MASEQSCRAGTEPIIEMVLDGLTSEHSKRAYRRALEDFLAWHAVRGRPPLSKALVQQYRAGLQEEGLAPSTINQRLSAVRKLAQEAGDNGLIDPLLSNGIKNVKGGKSAEIEEGQYPINYVEKVCR